MIAILLYTHETIGKVWIVYCFLFVCLFGWLFVYGYGFLRRR